MGLARTIRGNKNQAYATTTAATLTSDSFTPAAGSLLLCLFQEATTDATPSLTMSSTFAGQGAWTVRHVYLTDGFGSMIVSALAWSVCGASPGAGTITASRRAGNFAMGMNADFIEVSGIDSTTPERQYKTNTSGAVTDLDINFTSAPLATSMAFISSLMNGTTGLVTAPTGFSLVSPQFAIGSFAASSFEDLASVSQNNKITGGNGGNTNTGVGIEIQQSTGPNIYVRVGGVWTKVSGVKVRQGGIWVNVSQVKVRRSGSYVQI